jgi:hypothetical protein
MKRVLVSLLPIISLVLLSGGCAYTARQRAATVEPMLSAAGFKMKLADTPVRLAKLKALPQLKLKPLKRHGKLYFAYADADGCGCMYLGNQSAYQNYQGLVVQQHIVDEDRAAANVDEDAAIVEDDAAWDEWGADVW